MKAIFLTTSLISRAELSGSTVALTEDSTAKAIVKAKVFRSMEMAQSMSATFLKT
jgi:hypothetical protein